MEHHHSCAIHARNRGKVQKVVQKERNSSTHFKGTNTLRTMLGNPKDKDPQNNQTGIIYHYKCLQISCPSTYIGGIWLILRGKSQGTLQGPLPIHLHSTTTGHPMDPEQCSIVHKEVNSHFRTIK